MIFLGVGQGVLTVGFEEFLKQKDKPDLGAMMAFVVIMAWFNELANGANFSLVPHCNSYNNSVMRGLVGAFGNLGGMMFALMFRFQQGQGVAWVSAGVFALAINAILVLFPSPDS